jgi:hypothetical protein
LLCTLALFASGVTAGWSGASLGLGVLVTTAAESAASSSVPVTDAHLSVAFEDMILSLPGTTGLARISSESRYEPRIVMLLSRF